MEKGEFKPGGARVGPEDACGLVSRGRSTVVSFVNPKSTRNFRPCEKFCIVLLFLVHSSHFLQNEKSCK